MDGLQGAQGKDAADHAGDLQGQLLGGSQAVDAVGDRGLERVRQGQVFKVDQPRVHTGFMIFDDQDPELRKA